MSSGTPKRHALLEVFGITASELRAEIERLRLSVESGIVEYKRTRLAPVLSGLETGRFRTLALEEIAGHERVLTLLLLTVLVQRQLALGLLPVQKPPEQKSDFGVDGMQVNVILSDINSRIKADASLRSNAAVKNIRVQVQRFSDGRRRLASISEITGTEGNVITMQEVFAFRQTGVTEDGRVREGAPEPTPEVSARALLPPVLRPPSCGR